MKIISEQEAWQIIESQFCFCITVCCNAGQGYVQKNLIKELELAAVGRGLQRAVQSSRELRSGAESFRMTTHLSCPKAAEQGIAGQCGQLAWCTEQGSRTVVHLTDEPSGTCTDVRTVVHLHGPLVHLHGLQGFREVLCLDSGA